MSKIVDDKIKMEEPELSEIDAALHELGMLSSITESRKQYLEEQKVRRQSSNRKALNVLHMNARFVTDVIVGRRKEALNRYKPYSVPNVGREERARTKSENSDADIEQFYCTTIPPVINSGTALTNNLFKSRSMESLNVLASDEEDVSAPTHDVESVSNKIQFLQVTE